VENDMVYAQRLIEYANLKSENYYNKKNASSHSIPVTSINGEIEFRNVKLCYGKTL